jgi:glycosyltransferase involved in cell wall biosynthesis
MTPPPRTSILLPIHQAGETIAPCLRSVARQIDTDWECVIVDDGSTDAGPSIAQAFAARDARFKLESTPHLGLVPALISGLARCRGQFVARMDGDDVMHRARLREQVEWLAGDDSLAAVGCHVRVMPRRNLSDGMRAYETWLNSIDASSRVREEAFVECPVAHPTLVIRRQILEKFSYRDRGWPEDYDLLLRLLASGESVAVVPRRLLGWRDTHDRLSRVSPRYAIDRFTACKAEFLSQRFLAGSSRYTLWGYGATGRALQRALVEHGKRPTSILELHPGRIGNTIAGARVIHPDLWLERPEGPLVVSVAGSGPRRQIRAALRTAGLRETIDYICAA